MPMTKNGGFILKEDAESYASFHSNMAVIYESAAAVATNDDVKARAERLTKSEQEKADYYRAVARGDFNKVSA